MRFRFGALFPAVLVFFVLMVSLCRAGELADRKLLEILEQKGFLSVDEVRQVTEIIDREEAAGAQEKARLVDMIESDIEIAYDNGLHIRSRDETFSTRIGGVIQADYVFFDHSYPVDNDFDIRRARIFIEGRLHDCFSYRLEAELEGSSSNRLMDAYIDFDCFPAVKLRIGQFKEPFSLEHLISDKYLPFNERSMAYYLTPARDVGIMLHGSLLGDTLDYAVGVFNGDGRDAERRSQKDSKEITGRLTLQPFRHAGLAMLRGLHLGASGSYARLDTSDFNYAVSTPGRTKFLKVQARAKFNITQEVDSVERYGFECAYAFGPVVLMGEYIRNKYKDVSLVDTDLFDFDMRGWYAQILVLLTGETVSMKGGVLQKIKPKHDFDIRRGTWGALGIGFRYQEFEAGRVVYESLVYEGFSIRKADAFTIALNWYLNSMMRFSFNYSRTKFGDPLFLGTHWKGYSYYEDREHAWVSRFQLEF